jgi:hypothetical protein
MSIITLSVSLELSKIASTVKDEDARHSYTTAIDRMNKLTKAMQVAKIEDDNGEALFEVMTYLSAGSIAHGDEDALTVFVGRFLSTMHEWGMGPLRSSAIATATWEDGTLTLSAVPGKRQSINPAELLSRMQEAVAIEGIKAATPDELMLAAANAFGIDISNLSDLKKSA